MSPNIMPVFNKLLDSKLLNKMYKAAKDNPAKFAAQMALTSALTKDAVGCYYYVTQSLHNKKIPEENRNFVASIDLMNGILNVLLQFTVGSWLDKAAPKFFDNLMEKKLGTNKTRQIAKTLEEIINNKEITAVKIENFLKNKMLGKGGKTAKWLKVGFSAVSMLVATQIITKRMIVPFLSTPLAGWAEKNIFKKKDAPKVNIEPLNNKLSYQDNSSSGRTNLLSLYSKK
ncbi:MAG TPA: hypothetical protein PLG15_05465 [Candidatus Gastranaerophilaceae bacterium]|nr:hypothetical protein [Candidatus Gastranaerophilaceae bacterium]HPT41813.1 hypothetical protein [Candidatus Gastranaerophilaceae bacterium]